MLLEWLRNAGGTGWMALGLVLLIAETFAPGAFLMWFGLAALVTGLISWLIPALPWQFEIVCFALLSLGSILGYRWWQQTHPSKEPQVLRNRRGEEPLGRVFELQDAIVNGMGKIKLGDALWTVHGPDLPAGARVRLTAFTDMSYQVEPA